MGKMTVRFWSLSLRVRGDTEKLAADVRKCLIVRPTSRRFQRGTVVQYRSSYTEVLGSRLLPLYHVDRTIDLASNSTRPTSTVLKEYPGVFAGDRHGTGADSLAVRFHVPCRSDTHYSGTLLIGDTVYYS